MTLESTRRSLLERVRDLEDQGAWREFDDRYRELILRYASRRGLQAQDAEDVRQLVMMRMARHLPGFQYRPEIGRFRDYLQRTTQNAIRRHLEKRGRSKEVPLDEHRDLPQSVRGEPVEPDDHWDEEWILHHYRRAMERVRGSVTPKSLAIFEGLLDGRDAEDVAREHRTTAEAVYKVKQRIRDRLREHIERQLHEEEFAERQA